MSRFVLGGCLVVVVLALASLTGGAATGRAADPQILLDVTDTPGAVTQGMRGQYRFTVHNGGTNTLNHAQGVAALDVGTIESFSTSRGACEVSGEGTTLRCEWGRLPAREASPQIEVTVFARAPSAGASMTLSLEVRVDEVSNTGDRAHQHAFTDAEQTTLLAPDPNSVSTLAFGGETVRTKATGFGNAQSTSLTVSQLGAVLPVFLAEIPAVSNVCGASVTPFLQTSQISAPGNFSLAPLTVTLEWLLTAVPSQANEKRLRVCHDGVTLERCPTSGAIPAAGCVKTTQVVRSLGILRAIALAPSNGFWQGGI
jgi:hypothetical protein